MEQQQSKNAVYLVPSLLGQIVLKYHQRFDVSCFLEPSTTPTTLFHEPTEHELHCKSSVAGWDKIRKEIRMVVTEQAAMDEVQVCLLCGELAYLRCQHCGPFGFFAQNAFQVTIVRPIYFMCQRSVR